MKPKIRQTFYISDMIFSLKKMSDSLGDPNLTMAEEDEIIQKSIRIGLTLMAGYSSTMFTLHEMDFVQGYMKRLQGYTNKYLDNNSDSDFYG